MTKELLTIVGCGVFAGFVARPIFTASFATFARLRAGSGAAHLALLLVAAVVAMTSVGVVIFVSLWLFGLIPLAGRAPMWFVGFAVGSVLFILWKGRRNESV